ncbi:MAG: lysophospholipid acyltransferase family protein [Dysgonomonas sp.]|nr:lysophospholipid acyltransferase family protein [Dysgonomonas sp.]
MNKIGYYIIYFILYIHALLPFKVLYILSDILYFWVYKIVGYRLKVVRENLKSSFPDKNEHELKKIERQFYRHFCDYFVETIKLLHVSDKEIQERFVFNNMKIVHDLMSKGKSGIMYLGHYGNWEWVPSINLLFNDGSLLGQIYRPLKNKVFDEIFLKIRSRFGSVGIPKNDTLRAIINYKRQGEKILIGFMSDQSPSPGNIHYWTNFLNHETGVYTGVERIAKKTDFFVTYLDIIKEGRGRYTAHVKLITDNPKVEPEFTITEKYIREMEKTILREPAYWLWTHKRWKHKKENIIKE